MTTLQGADDNSGFGVLGSGAPWTFVDRDDTTVPVNSVGVWGVLATTDDVSNIVDEVSNNFGPLGQPISAAVLGRNALPQGGTAVYGEARTFLGRATTKGFLAGTDPRFNQSTGAYGESEDHGVMGVGNNNGTGVLGVGRTGGSFEGAFEGIHAVGHDPRAAGIAGYNDNTGPGVYGKSVGGAAGYFDGDVTVTGNVHLSSVNGDVILADVAESFSAHDDDSIDPGTVVVLGDQGLVRAGDVAYDKKVAGVVAGAGGYRSAIVLDQQHSSQRQLVVALIGKVCCKVDATYGRIEIGDLLTTSPTSGHAMKADNPVKAFGAVIGKALQPLNDGRGLIPILIALQ